MMGGIGNESMTGVLGVGFCELDLKDGWMDGKWEGFYAVGARR
jgi:hypothetical protein